MGTSKIKISLSSTDAQTSESRGKKGGKRSPRQVFYSELMKRLAGDPGSDVADAFVSDKAKFKSLMIGIIGKMADTETDE